MRRTGQTDDDKGEGGRGTHTRTHSLPRLEPDMEDGWWLVFPSGERLWVPETGEGVAALEALGVL